MFLEVLRPRYFSASICFSMSSISFSQGAAATAGTGSGTGLVSDLQWLKRYRQYHVHFFWCVCVAARRQQGKHQHCVYHYESPYRGVFEDSMFLTSMFGRCIT